MLTSYTISPQNGSGNPLRLRKHIKFWAEAKICALHCEGRKMRPGPRSCAVQGCRDAGRPASQDLDAELFHLVVVVLAVEDVPLLRAFEDDLALRADLQPCRLVDL